MNDDCLQDDDLYGLPRVLASVLLPYPAGAETSINGRRGSFSSRSSSLGRRTWSAGTGGRWSLLRRIGVCGVCVSNPLLSKLVLTLSSPYGPLYSVLDAHDRLLAKSDLHQEIDRRLTGDSGKRTSRLPFPKGISTRAVWMNWSLCGPRKLTDGVFLGLIDICGLQENEK